MKRTSGLCLVGGLDVTQQQQPEARAFTHRQPVDGRSTTPTAENGRLRKDRRAAWRRAEVLRQYWSTMLEMESVIGSAKSHGAMPLSALHSLPFDRNTILVKYREALAQQMRTPVSDIAGLKWKQEALAKERYHYTGVTPERLRQAIAEDAAWLAAHPTRRSNSEAMARSREFKEAMRQRIREVAADRGLSDEHIKPALSLKHHEIARFSEQQGVSIGWQLEGELNRDGRCDLMDILDGA
jgi:hypothetical protein